MKTTSAGNELTDDMLIKVWDAMPHSDVVEVLLRAPDKETAKQWMKDYPGIKVVVVSKGPLTHGVSQWVEKNKV